ncbi:MAG: hypothetical protein AAFP69_19865, partial [Planctomycetota bacterium]
QIMRDRMVGSNPKGRYGEGKWKVIGRCGSPLIVDQIAPVGRGITILLFSMLIGVGGSIHQWEFACMRREQTKE